MGRMFKVFGWLLFAAYGFGALVFWLFAVDMLIKGEAGRWDLLVLAVLLTVPAIAVLYTRRKSQRRLEETKREAKRRAAVWVYLGVLYALVLALTALSLAVDSWGIALVTCLFAALGLLGPAAYLKLMGQQEKLEQKRTQAILDTPMEDLVAKRLEDEDKRSE